MTSRLGEGTLDRESRGPGDPSVVLSLMIPKGRGPFGAGTWHPLSIGTGSVHEEAGDPQFPHLEMG